MVLVQQRDNSKQGPNIYGNTPYVRYFRDGLNLQYLTSAIDSGTFERATIAATVFCWESFRGILRKKSRWSPLGFQRYRNQSEKLNRPFLLDLQRFRAENAGGIF